MRKLTIEALSSRQNLANARVFVRVDFNVPMKQQAITDDTRIRASLPTILFLKNLGARVILCSHLGRPDGKVKEELRMFPIANRLSELLGVLVPNLSDCIGPNISSHINAMQPGDVVLLENIRFYPGEEANDPEFCAKLAELADIFVNDAFGTAHRPHASTCGISQHIPTSVSGFLMDRELSFLNLDNQLHPLGVIIGGSKVSTKLPIIQHLLTKCEYLMLGGGLAFTFLKANGHNIGKSLVEDDLIPIAQEIMTTARRQNIQLLLPTDIIVASSMSQDSPYRTVQLSSESMMMMCEGEMGLDIGPETVQRFSSTISACKTVLWNGPMGVFEIANFAHGTMAIAHFLASSSSSSSGGQGLISIIGGGESVAAVHQAGVEHQVSFVSTGGGVTLQLLAGEVLPGVECLMNA